MKRGFTLIELLVTISILSLLVSLSLASFSVARDKAKRARARFEIIQIFKASELVFNEKKYYPNDYHGSIICPSEIDIDDSGTKLKTFIDICNDIDGNAYLWNNLCGSNGKERNGSHPQCDPFTDDDPGPIGVIYVGKNGINDLCTFDDICFGKRNFPNFSLSEDECPYDCLDTGACAEIIVQNDCTAQNGCKWIGGQSPSPHCVPQNACSTNNNIVTCNADYSCNWAETECEI